MTHLWRLRSAHDTNTNTIVLVVLSKSAALVPSHWFLCSSRNVSFVEELADADYAMVTYKCGLSAGTTGSTEPRLVRRGARQLQPIPVLLKPPPRVQHRDRTSQNSVANMNDEAKKRQQQNRVALGLSRMS